MVDLLLRKPGLLITRDFVSFIDASAQLKVPAAVAPLSIVAIPRAATAI